MRMPDEISAWVELLCEIGHCCLCARAIVIVIDMQPLRSLHIKQIVIRQIWKEIKYILTICPSRWIFDGDNIRSARVWSKIRMRFRMSRESINRILWFSLCVLQWHLHLFAILIACLDIPNIILPNRKYRTTKINYQSNIKGSICHKYSNIIAEQWAIFDLNKEWIKQM